MTKKVSIAGFIVLGILIFGLLGIVYAQPEERPALEKAKGKIEMTKEEAPGLVSAGEYIVTLGGCNDCHSPKVFTETGPHPDMSRILSGHPASEAIPAVPTGVIGPNTWGFIGNNGMTAWAGPWGVSYTFNLTPDQATGIGAWTEETFIQAMHTGKHMGAGRQILPPMPWYEIGKAKDSDLKAVFAYLKSLKPINNQVPQPTPPAAGMNKP